MYIMHIYNSRDMRAHKVVYIKKATLENVLVSKSGRVTIGNVGMTLPHMYEICKW